MSLPKQKRHRNYIIRSVILFLLFVLLAAPIKYHMTLYSLLWSSNGIPFLSPLSSGLLYFYSVTVAIEALVRIEASPSTTNDDLRVFGLKLLCVGIIGIFILEYFASGNYSQTPVPETALAIQFGVAVFAMACAISVHYILVTQEARRIR